MKATPHPQKEDLKGHQGPRNRSTTADSSGHGPRQGLINSQKRIYPQHILDAANDSSKRERTVSGLEETSSDTRLGLTESTMLGGLTATAPTLNPSTPPPAQDPPPHIPTEIDYKTYEELTDFTLTELNAYVQRQADWHAGPSLDDAQRSNIRKLLDFARKPKILTHCGNMPGKRILEEAENSSFDIVTGHLATYAESVDKYQRRVPSNAPFFEANEIGDTIQTLLTGFPEGVLQKSLWPEVLALLSIYDKDCVKYYLQSSPQPQFLNDKGEDFSSYCTMRSRDKIDPLSYQTGSLQGHIRNFHRFERQTLKIIEENFAATTPSKPLRLIIHSGFDHENVFHRNPNLFELVSDPQHLTLMIEGKETLAEIEKEVTDIAARYGVNGKIHQVVLVGHGSSRSMEMAGKTQLHTTTRALEVVADDIDLDNNLASTTRFFETLLANMPKNKPGVAPLGLQILLDGCSTAAYAFDDMDPAIAGINPGVTADVQSWMRNKPSLKDWLQQLADTKNGKGVEVIGARASFTKNIDLMSTDGNLDMSTPIDPLIEGTALEYVEKGIEPQGVFSALMEVWSTNDAAARQAIKDRLAATAIKHIWDGEIRGLFAKLDDGSIPLTGQNIRALGLFVQVVQSLLTAEKFSMTGINLLYGLDYSTVWDQMVGNPGWKPHYAIIFGQLRIAGQQSDGLFSKSARESLLAGIESSTDCSKASAWIDIDWVVTSNNLIRLLAGSPSKPKTILAILALQKYPTSKPAIKYLKALLDESDQFDPQIGINDLMSGIFTLDELLIAIGKKQAPATTSAPTSPIKPSKSVKEEKANMPSRGGDKNTLLVKSVNFSGTIILASSAVYEDPEMSKQAGHLDKDTPVIIFGESGSMWAIEYRYGPNELGSAFVKKSDVKLVP